MTVPTPSSAPYIGTCHCGAVRIAIPRKPEYLNDCNCTLCTKHAGLWGYFDPVEISIVGETQNYTRADLLEPAMAIHFCGICACVTHWRLLTTFAAAHPDMTSRMGINMRLFAAETVNGVEVRFPDGRAW
jgi:hypothetical protein